MRKHDSLKGLKMRIDINTYLATIKEERDKAQKKIFFPSLKS